MKWLHHQGLTKPHPIFQELKHQTEVTLNIVHCPPVTTAVIRRPDSKYQLGFCVENGVVSAQGRERSQTGVSRGFHHLPARRTHGSGRVARLQHSSRRRG